MFRSQLFVPCNNEKMIKKTQEIPADSFIFDLEDAVPPQEKEKAREMLTLIPDLKGTICVRINPLYSKESLKDILSVMNIDKIECIVIPKADVDVSFIYKMTGKRVFPLIENAKGLLKIEEVIRSEGILGISWGSADLADSLNADVETIGWSEYIRLKITTTAKTYGVSPLDRVYFDVKNLEGFKKECITAKNQGFEGKQVIHPNQVTIANEVFSHSSSEIEWAKKIVEEYEKYASLGKGALSVEGKLVDAVHYRIAKKILENQ
ncbi:HpcH/HpaI aldolase/citrate lyase family protein [Acidianus manzaensis]|uniref:CoA ester lyase n=1 Tax=Acidianus manzaensis TaxID=282676 RepID=A0A1W6JWU8_9CREN|nr:CoA ester lyase [Acidianus manzaensis]ARM74727.1 CoA ester lyase [Acidianus manzaensis]